MTQQECAHTVAMTLAAELKPGQEALVWCRECEQYVTVTQEGINDRHED
jgi:hypothetical protein